MIEWFPHERAPLPKTHLRYVDLESVFTDGKVERESRAPGFVLLYFGEETYVVFVVGGEPVTATRFSAQERGVVPLSAMRRRARNEREWADVAYFLAPEPQLRAMFATAACVPDMTGAELDVSRVGRLFALARERAYSGVVEFREGRKAHYLVFDDGLPVHGFFADERGSDEGITGETLSSRLERLFEPGRVEQLKASAYPSVSRLPAQAPLGLQDVYSELIASAVDRTAEAIGHENALRGFDQALERVAERKPTLRNYSLGPGGRLQGESCASADELTDGIAALLFEALTNAGRAGAPDAATVLQGVTHGNRFVLQANGFFNRFPWPVDS